jgi:hypothetical protein
MPGLLDSFGHTPARVPGGVAQARVVAYRGSTAANGDVTLAAGNTYEGALTAPTRSTNTYTVNIGTFARGLACCVSSGVGAVTAVTFDGAAGTVAYTMSATQVSTTHDVVIYVDRGMGG